MRSALAHALAAEGLDDRTIIRTIAWWRAHGHRWEPPNEATAHGYIKIMRNNKIGACP